MKTSAVGTVSAVLGPLALLAAFVVSGAAQPATPVLAALTARATTGQATSAAYWSVIVNGSTGAKSVALPASYAATFSLSNNGNVAISAMTVRVTNSTNRSVRVCPNGGSCNSGGTTIGAGSNATISHSASQRPSAVGAGVTWSFRRSGGSSSGVSGSISVSVTVSSTAASRSVAAPLMVPMSFAIAEEPDPAPTATPTPTPTPTPTASPTASPTATPTASPAASPSDPATPSPTASAAASPTPTAAASPTPTPTPAPSDTAPATPTTTASPSATGTVG